MTRTAFIYTAWPKSSSIHSLSVTSQQIPLERMNFDVDFLFAGLLTWSGVSSTTRADIMLCKCRMHRPRDLRTVIQSAWACGGCTSTTFVKLRSTFRLRNYPVWQVHHLFHCRSTDLSNFIPSQTSARLPVYRYSRCRVIRLCFNQRTCLSEG